MGALQRYGAFSPIGGAVRSVLLGRCGAMGVQPYRGRRSLSAIGALRRYGALSPIGDAEALLGALRRYGATLSPIGGAIRSALWGRSQPYRGRSSRCPMGALQRYGAVQPYRGRCSAMGALFTQPYGGAAALWGRSAL